MHKNIHRKVFYIRAVLITLNFIILLWGCKSVSPTKVIADKRDYSQVISDSWKQQTLLNVVRLRYADAPVFLEISSIINSNSVGGSLAAGTGFPGAAPSGITFNLGAGTTWSNTPTVSYFPLMGEHFTRMLLQPIPVASVFQLIESGWNAEMVLRTIVTSINGLHNASRGVAADSAFLELINSVSCIQRSGGLGLRVEASEDDVKVLMVLPSAPEGTPLKAQTELVRELLNLNQDSNEFRIEFGLHPKNSQEIVIISRSMLDLMIQLGFGIDLPPNHLEEGRVIPGDWNPGEKRAKIISHIHSGLKEPEESFVAVQYKDYWYWIEDTDIQSKQIFSFLMILFSLAANGETYPGPVITVPSR